MSMLEQKVALITAAGSGMGRRSAVRMAEEGATVIVTDLSLEAAQGTVDEITGAGGSAVARQLDVGDLDALKATSEEVARDYGVLDVLFNHAGLPGPPGLEIAPEVWTRCIDINMRSGFFLTSYLLAPLRASKGASILFTSSGAGLVGSAFSPLYSLTKGGIVAFVRALALNLAPDGIRANAICPGATDTPMLPGFFDGSDPEEVEQKKLALFASVPLGRLATPGDIAETAVFLASDRAAFITGVSLAVDGGFTAR